MNHLYRFLRFPEGKLKAVTFSYDDGVRQDIRFAELLSAHGMKGTFNLNSGVANDDRVPQKEFKKLYQGHEIACHGLTH